MTNQTKVSPRNLFEILIIALTSFVSILMTTAVNVNLPEFVNFFHTTLSNVQWFATGPMIVAAVTMMSSTYLDHRFNDRTNFLISEILLFLSLIACATTSNFVIFLFGRILEGISMGICTPLMINLIPRMVPKSKIGFFMASGTTVIATGPSLGPVYGGFINYYFGWRMIFLALIPVTISLMIAGFFVIVNHLSINQNKAFDWQGFTLVLVALATIATGFNTLNHASFITLILFLVGITSVVLFLRHGNRHSNAILKTKVLRYRQFDFYLLAYFLIESTNISLSGILIPNFSQVVLGATSIMAGLILLPGNLVRIANMPFAGAIMDKYGAKFPIYTGLILMAIYFGLMSLFSKDLTNGWLLLCYIIYNLGLALAFSNVLTHSLQTLPVPVKDDGNAILNTVQIYGGAIGNCLLSLIISLAGKFGSSRINSMQLGGQWCFIFLLIIIIIATTFIHCGFKNERSK